MKLSELSGAFVALTYDGHMRRVDTIEEAQGVIFKCPKCWKDKGGPIGVHSVICWSRSRGVPDDITPGPGRWRLVGTGIDDLSLMADPPGKMKSVHLTGAGGCGWHGFVTDGDAA